VIFFGRTSRCGRGVHNVFMAKTLRQLKCGIELLVFAEWM